MRAFPAVRGFGRVMGKFYAVRVGRAPGVYKTWGECESVVKGFSGAVFKGFTSQAEAERYLQVGGGSAASSGGGGTTPGNAAFLNSGTGKKRANEGGSDSAGRDKPKPRRESPAGSGDADAGGFSLWFDGGSRGNGKKGAVAGSGAILYHDKVCVWKGGRYLGGATNNEAEYTGLIIGLEEAVRQGARSIVVRGDSQLVVLQVSGEWKCSKEHLVPLRDRYALAHGGTATLKTVCECSVRELLREFDSSQVLHVLRGLNKEADMLANRAMDKRLDFSERLVDDSTSCHLGGEKSDKPADRAHVGSRDDPLVIDDCSDKESP